MTYGLEGLGTLTSSLLLSILWLGVSGYETTPSGCYVSCKDPSLFMILLFPLVDLSKSQYNISPTDNHTPVLFARLFHYKFVSGLTSLHVIV